MDFIRVYENVIEDSLCDKIIKYYEDNHDKTNIRSKHAIDKKSVVLIPSYTHDVEMKYILTELKKSFDKYYTKYINSLPLNSKECAFKTHLQNENLFLENIVIEKMGKGDFHGWHHDDVYPLRRTVSCIWYLNTLCEDDGGYTEFECGKKNIPKKGSLMFFPSEWIHIHCHTPIIKDMTRYTCKTWITINQPENISHNSIEPIIHKHYII